MTKPAVLVIATLVVLWFAVKGNSQPKELEDVVSNSKITSSAPIGPVRASLYEQNKSGESGVIEITSLGEKTKIVVTLGSKKNREMQPVHLHTGMCPSPGAIKYILNDMVEGVSQTVLDSKIEDVLSDSTLAINIHKSVKDPTVAVGCGDIKK